MLIRADSKSRFGVALVVSLACYAAPGALDAQVVDECEAVGRLAAKIMQTRQNETPLSTVLELFDKQQGTPEYKAAIRRVVLAAYDQPAMRTDANKENQVASFRNVVETECYLSFLQIP